MKEYRNTSDKTLHMRAESLKPGEESSLEDCTDAEISSFVERGYLEEVGSGTESTSADEESEEDEGLSEKERKIAETDFSEEFLGKLQKLEGIGDKTSKEVALDFEDWEDFKDGVDSVYLDEKGLREDQIEANLEKHIPQIE
jgi:hypothetical protein